MVWMLDILSDYHVLRRYVFQGLNGTVSPESEDPHKPDNMPKDELTAVLKIWCPKDVNFSFPWLESLAHALWTETYLCQLRAGAICLGTNRHCSQKRIEGIKNGSETGRKRQFKERKLCKEGKRERVRLFWELWHNCDCSCMWPTPGRQKIQFSLQEVEISDAHL